MVCRRNVILGGCMAVLSPTSWISEAQAHPILLKIGIIAIRTIFTALIGYETVERYKEFQKRKNDIEEKIQSAGYIPWYMKQVNYANAIAFNSSDRACAGVINFDLLSEGSRESEVNSRPIKFALPPEKRQELQLAFSDFSRPGPKVLVPRISSRDDILITDKDAVRRVYVIDPASIAG